MPRIKDLTDLLESIAPLNYQESYDNSGLIYGDENREISGVLVSLDCTESIVDEAIEKGCNVIVSHHPLVFSGIKKFKKGTWVHDTLIKAIVNDVAIYAIHTNLDNVLENGVNQKIAEKLQLDNISILAPADKNTEIRFWTSELLQPNIQECVDSYAQIHVQAVSAVHHDRSGTMYYVSGPDKDISQMLQDIAQYKPQILDRKKGLQSPQVGAGLIGELHYPMPEEQFLKHIVGKMSVSCIRHTRFLNKSVSKVVVCGGSGRFLLERAISAGADAFITGDFKYHDFFEANNQILVADIGHFESEQYTIDILIGIIRENFTTFATHYTEVNTNPVYYYG